MTHLEPLFVGAMSQENTLSQVTQLSSDLDISRWVLLQGEGSDDKFSTPHPVSLINSSC